MVKPCGLAQLQTTITKPNHNRITSTRKCSHCFPSFNMNLTPFHPVPLKRKIYRG